MIAGQALGFLTTSRCPGVLTFSSKNVRLAIKDFRRLLQPQSDPSETPRLIIGTENTTMAATASRELEDNASEEARVVEVKGPTKFEGLETMAKYSNVLYVAAIVTAVVVAAFRIAEYLNSADEFSLFVLFNVICMAVLTASGGGERGGAIVILFFPLYTAILYFPVMLLSHIFKF